MTCSLSVEFFRISGEAFLTIFGGERKQQLDFQVSLKKYDMEVRNTLRIHLVLIVSTFCL